MRPAPDADASDEAAPVGGPAAAAGVPLSAISSIVVGMLVALLGIAALVLRGAPAAAGARGEGETSDSAVTRIRALLRPVWIEPVALVVALVGIALVVVGAVALAL